MNRVTEILENDHGTCDHHFASAEAAAYCSDWTGCGSALSTLQQGLEAHFRAEETVLFPAFEEATGMRGGPTAMMRLEHEQMRELLENLAQACTERSVGSFAGAAETLLVLMGQHNMKEQNILYPMCDRALGDGDGHLGQALRSIIGSDSCRVGA